MRIARGNYFCSAPIVLAGALAACTTVSIRAPSAQVQTGIDVLETDGFQELKGKRIGLITNPTGKDRQGRSTAEVLASAPGVSLVSLFAPEHGITGKSEENSISSSTIVLAGRTLPVHSLYSGGLAGMRPKPEDLRDLDALVFDIQDIGTRFYTYLASLGMALEEAAKAGIELVVLDRPNPVTGTIIEGPILDDLSLRKLSPTRYYAVSIRHGMTAGEIARFHNAEVRSPRLTVVKLRGWRREQWYDQTGLPWTAPSPNMPDLDAAALYPGIGLFEASNISVGRGTPWPFRWIGAPWMNAQALVDKINAAHLDGVGFSVEDHTPSKSAFSGLPCRGVRLHILDRDRMRPVAIYLKLCQILRELHPQEFKLDWQGLKQMTGTAEYQRLLESGADEKKIKEFFDLGARNFAEIRRPFLLY